MRSADSRRRILAAMRALIEEGDPEPAAETVATRAGVGLRTVFRLFRDMESVCAEMLVPQRAKFTACFLTPFVAPSGPEHIRELFGRLAILFEQNMQLRRAGMLRRYSSPSLAAAIQELDQGIALFIDRALLGEGEAHRYRIDMLNLLMSFETWIRLRDSQHLSAEQTRGTIQTAIDALLQ